MNDPVVLDEARHDRERQQQEALMKQARVIAQTAYEAGELDDWIEEVVDSHDSFKLAHAVLQWHDEMQDVPININSQKYMRLMLVKTTKLVAMLPACSLRDFEANIEFVIEEKAKLLVEDM